MKSIGINGKYFRAVATPNREKPKEEVSPANMTPQNILYLTATS